MLPSRRARSGDSDTSASTRTKGNCKDLLLFASGEGEIRITGTKRKGESYLIYRSLNGIAD